jgi:small subunit ribosomal protein S2
MPRTEFKQLLDAGVHFGHLKRKWNPAMAPYIFMEKNGIHIIDLQKTIVKIDEAAEALKQISRSGRKVLFVATKKQAKSIVAEKVTAINMPYVAERWPGGMLTNFPTIRKAVKKMSSIDKMMKDAAWDNLSKREKLQITRQRAKLEKVLGSIVDLTRLPAALFIVDVLKEKIAVREAQRLSIPIFAMVDTNSNPEGIDFVIPSNDDASQSIDLIISTMCEAIKDGLSDRKVEREKDEVDEKPLALKKGGRKAVVKIIVEDDIEEADEKEDLSDDTIADLLADEDLLDEEVLDEEIADEDAIDVK